MSYFLRFFGAFSASGRVRKQSCDYLLSSEPDWRVSSHPTQAYSKLRASFTQYMARSGCIRRGVILFNIGSGWPARSGSAMCPVLPRRPLIIHCPLNLVVNRTSNGPVVNYQVTAHTTCDANVPVACSIPSGSFFPPCTPFANCTATNLVGMTAKRRFSATDWFSGQNWDRPHLGGHDAFLGLHRNAGVRGQRAGSVVASDQRHHELHAAGGRPLPLFQRSVLRRGRAPGELPRQKTALPECDRSWVAADRSLCVPPQSLHPECPIR